MEPFVPIQKLGKKARRDLYLKQRRVWGINPITRKQINPKAYKRKKVQPVDDFITQVEPF